MKSYYSAWVAALSLSLLSGCAFVQGLHDQKSVPPAKNGKAVAVPQEESNAPNLRGADASSEASKMIAPITH